MRRAIFSFLIALLGCVSLASAETKMSLDIGWDGKFRAGQWTPIYATISDDMPRAVLMEVEAPYDRRYQIVIQQGLTIGTNPITVPIYVPLNQSLSETRITLRSASGRRLASVPIEDEFSDRSVLRASGPQQVAPGVVFAGISGNVASERLVETQLASDRVTLAYLKPERLPAVPTGYDGLDLLILNQPDLNRIAEDQQQAIVQWVRAGGNLLMWPGPEPVPVTSPIVDALPARIGENRNYDVDAKQLKYAGLPDRFKLLKGRTLGPIPGAVKVSMFSGTDVVGYRARVGYGQMILLPVDASVLRFDTNTKSEALWRKVLAGMVEIPEAPKDGSLSQQRVYYGNTLDNREQQALTQTLNWMGNIPGAGTFGFSYIAIVLIVMMVIVGPVDWFVLKMMGRQPWTWVTTAGWSGLITLGAIFIGYAFKSGDLHFRTTSIIDEADSVRVAATDVAAIYSPKTSDYDLKCDTEGWWRPASEFVGWSGGGGLKVDIPCHQDYHGNRPLPLRVNVWNLRLLEGTTLATAPAMIESKLTLKYDSKLKKRVVSGTITNRGGDVLKNVIVRLNDGVARVSPAIEAGATAEVSAPVDTRDSTFAVTEQSPRYYSPWGGDIGPTSQPSVSKIADLASGRSERVEKLLKQYRDTACVYAECAAAPETVKLELPEAKRLHQQVIRSLVHLERIDATTKPQLQVITPKPQ